MQIFVRLYAIESIIELSKEFWKKCNSSASCRDICTQIASLLFLMIYILCVNFCAISLTRNRDELIPKIPEKVLLQLHLLNDFHLKLLEINLLYQDITKCNILRNSVHQFSSYTCHKIFVTDRQTHTHRHFPEIVESCSGHPKMCKFIKNRKWKICTKPILSSIYIEESKKKKR